MTHTTNPTLVVGLAVLVASFSLVHLARRWPTLRTRLRLADEVTFTRVQRLIHWTIGPGCIALFLSGLPVYLAQFMVNPPVPTPMQFFYWGFKVASWRTFHIYVALMIVALVFIHSIWDTYRIRPSRRIIHVSRAEFDDALRRARAFLGLAQAPSEEVPKYDFFHKAYHWTLISLGAFLLVTGLIEWEAFQIQGVPVFVILDRFNNALMDGFLRTGHLVAGVIFGALVAIHVYFSILPQNRPFLRAISLGGPRSSASDRAETSAEMTHEPELTAGPSRSGS